MAVEHLAAKEIVGCLLKTVQHHAKLELVVAVHVQPDVGVAVTVQPETDLDRRSLERGQRHAGLVRQGGFIGHCQDFAFRFLFLLVARRVADKRTDEVPASLIGRDQTVARSVDDVSEAVTPKLVLVGVILAKVFVSSVVAQRGDGVVGAQAVKGLSVGAVVVEHVDANRHVHGVVVQGELTRDGQHGLRCFPVSYLVSSGGSPPWGWLTWGACSRPPR